MEFNDLKDKHEKADVFDMVNDTFLNLKGDRRRILRSQFMNVWKQNKNVGCADLFMALFNSIDTLDSWERSLRDDVDKGVGYSTKDLKEKAMPFLTYRKIVNGIRAESDELAQEIEDLREDCITNKEHNQNMKDAQRNQEYKHSEEMLDLERKHKSEILALRRRVASAEASEANAVKMYEMASKCANMQES
tara:strand:- start:1176 stop:1748 length:573 start_codon:yes stop_codon:yes gene_type:complete